MKTVLLAAGYATRLYPLTKDTPKPLLPLGRCTVLEHILDKVYETRDVDGICLVTNARFASHFREWLDSHPQLLPWDILDDGTTSNETRLGALGDLQLAIDALKLQDDLMVLAADNVFEFSLQEFIDFFHHKQADCITAHRLQDYRRLQGSGIITVDAEQRVLSFEEKPTEPKSDLAVPPVYLYRAATLPLLRRYLDEGQTPDAPGHFVPWLLQHVPVYAHIFCGERWDIGTPESYAQAQTLFS